MKYCILITALFFSILAHSQKTTIKINNNQSTDTTIFRDGTKQWSAASKSIHDSLETVVRTETDPVYNSEKASYSLKSDTTTYNASKFFTGKSIHDSLAYAANSKLFKWNTSGRYYEPYSSKAETGSNSCVYLGDERPNSYVYGNKITFNGIFSSHNILSNRSLSNYGIGEFVLSSITTGTGNISLGTSSLSHLTTGIDNIGIRSGLPQLVSGNANIGIGVLSLGNLISGNDNIGIGEAAGYSILGNNNICIGKMAGFYATGSGNIFLGYRAGYNETGTDKLYISNSSSQTLIFGDFNANLVRITGKLEATGAIEITTADEGIILKSSAGARYKLTIGNDGKLNITAL